MAVTAKRNADAAVGMDVLPLTAAIRIALAVTTLASPLPTTCCCSKHD
jgi:hypothetical protein